MIQRRGNQPLNLVHVVARLQLARALRASGDAAAARETYTAFTSAWRNADPRHPLLVAAAREAADLQSAAPAR